MVDLLPGFTHSGTSTANRPAWLHLQNAINICSTSVLVSIRLLFFLVVPISATRFLALVLSASIVQHRHAILAIYFLGLSPMM